MSKSQKSKGEFELIRQLTWNLPPYTKDVISGVGDDCAVLGGQTGLHTLVTCDTQIAGVHFLPRIAKPEQVGQKALAVNISDIAAMGGKPDFCLVSLIIPQYTDPVYINNLYYGIRSIAKTYNIQIIGGNISQGKQLVIDIFLLGKVKPAELLLRSGAKPGDFILVTGTLGDAASGLALLKDEKISIPQKERTRLTLKQLTPTPRLEEASVIAKSKQATAMIDISDGLASDLGHICEQSKVGAEIDEARIPAGNNSLELALSGGEDYELLFTAPPRSCKKIVETVKRETGTSVSIIGEIMPLEKGNWIKMKNGQRKPLIFSGWDHFK